MLNKVFIIISLTSYVLLGSVNSLAGSDCLAGFFGPECRDCHCNGACDSRTGWCSRACRQEAENVDKWHGPTCQLENKALNKKTVQSSMGIKRGQKPKSNLAVDGKKDLDFFQGQSCTMTKEEDLPWWRVDLGAPYVIQSIQILNTATTEHRSKLAGFEVYLSNSSSIGALQVFCYRHPNPSAIGLNISFTCNSSQTGQFVTVKQPYHRTLILCEVQVFVCSDGSYGHNCKEVCGPCLLGPCDPLTGRCPAELCSPGWTGPDCKSNCPVGRFGSGCKNICGGCRADTTCDRIDGRCMEGCAGGLKTQYCNVTCNSPCVESCGHCLNNDLCDTKYNTGVCHSGCAAGWKTELCNKACPDGLYGIGCQLECANCKTDSLCDLVTGECPDGCQRGWIGSSCDIRDGPEEPLGGTGSNPNNGGNKTGVIVGCVFAAIVVMAAGLMGLLYYKRKNNKPRGDEILRITRLNGSTIHGRENPGLSREPNERKPDGNHNTSPAKVPPVPIATNPAQISASSLITIAPIPVSELKEYIQSKEDSKFGFQPEFEMLPVGLMTHADMGTLPFNRPKNRFQAICPYDYNRIILETSDGDPLYQYVNASFIDGYKKAKAYIIAQAPLKATAFDFWRMIWQENVGKIVMITKLVEAGKVKSEQYWSDFDTRTFGHFVVQLETSVELADFTLRTLLITNSVTSEQRTIKHFHFTSWPDHGVPRHPLAVLFFRKKVVSATTTCTGPMIVHCSAGIGRSGTYIALDMLIQQSAREKVVDVYNTVVRLRQQRANVIPSLEQYGFLYEALLEAIWFGDTSIPMGDFKSKFEKINKMNALEGSSKLQDEFEVNKHFVVVLVPREFLPNMTFKSQLLESIKPVQSEDELKSALTPDNIVKNRHQDILAGDHHRPLLSTHHPGTTDYINAVKIPSYRQKTVFFVTEVPLPLIVMDFWRLVYDHACSTIVLLGDIDTKDKACGVYWPEEIGVVHMERFQVELASTTQLKHNITERQLKLNVLQGIKKERMVKQFHFPDWELDSDVPESREALLYLLKTVENWQQECGTQPVIIQCLDGCRCSGVFCAIYLLLERLNIDREADVFSTIRLIRDPRPQFITSCDQYRFCYEALSDHLSEISEDTEAL